jgi:enamine deaminase RidA (YjgF/YER057c/UK114 family)
MDDGGFRRATPRQHHAARRASSYRTRLTRKSRSAGRQHDQAIAERRAAPHFLALSAAFDSCFNAAERPHCRQHGRTSMSAEARLKELGIVLPVVPTPVANYVPYRLAGSLLFLSGQGPRDEKGATLTGKVGKDVTVEEAYRRARLIGLGLLAATRQALGSLDRVDYVVKLLGMVNAVPDFTDQPKVINGCSDLFVEVFGDDGRHARSAVGMGSLPNQISVEIEAIMAVKT